MNIHQELSVNTLDSKEVRFPSELYLEGLILMNTKLLTINGYGTPEKITNQLTLCNKKRIDLILLYDNYIGVIELKNIEINASAFNQLESYLKEKENILKHEKITSFFGKDMDVPKKIVGILSGNSITEDALKKIKGHNENSKNIKIVVILIKKYETNNDQLFITSTCINANEMGGSNSKDYTTYEYNGEKYGKGRLVLSVISDYISNNNINSIVELEQKFPKNLQGSFGCFRKFDEITQKEMVRFFSNDSDLLRVGRVKIAVCNQWGVQNIKRFLYCCEKLKIEIKTKNKKTNKHKPIKTK